MGIGRKIARTKSRRELDTTLEGARTALKTLSNLDQVTKLNELLGIVHGVMPRLHEVQQACAGLIQEKADLERRMDRERAATLGLFAHFLRIQPDAVLEFYNELSSQWEEENPSAPVMGSETEAPALPTASLPPIDPMSALAAGA